MSDDLYTHLKNTVDPQALRALRLLLDTLEESDDLAEHAMRQRDSDTYAGYLSPGRTIVVRGTCDPLIAEHRDPQFWLSRLENGIVWIEESF